MQELPLYWFPFRFIRVILLFKQSELIGLAGTTICVALTQRSVIVGESLQNLA